MKKGWDREDLNKRDNSILWYLVGLITSDGYLSPDGRHIDVTSKDYKFLDELRKNIYIKNRIGIKNKGRYKAHRIQISSKSFYQFLVSVGLKTKKSLDIKCVSIPEYRFGDFLRGLIDGDGNIRMWAHPTNQCEQWVLRIYSGSIAFVKWLQNKIEDILNVKGRIYHTIDKKGDGYVLKYGKMAARVILSKCYSKGTFSMARKRILADRCKKSYIGWTKSQTVLL